MPHHVVVDRVEDDTLVDDRLPGVAAVDDPVAFIQFVLMGAAGIFEAVRLPDERTLEDHAADVGHVLLGINRLIRKRDTAFAHLARL